MLFIVFSFCGLADVLWHGIAQGARGAVRPPKPLHHWDVMYGAIRRAPVQGGLACPHDIGLTFGQTFRALALDKAGSLFGRGIGGVKGFMRVWCEHLSLKPCLKGGAGLC